VVQRYATGRMIGGFESRQELRVLLFTTASTPALEPTHPLIQWVPAALSLGVKRPGREADHSTPSSTEFKNALSCISIPPIRLHSVMLCKINSSCYVGSVTAA
jgi:hypothetical protein